ncbi:hypothetical protein CRENBAI_025213 [Crenichthys baileyi]|uniref:Uncharacterized protein n=1 Tax=Crenichthys baileyi TaxID=28760 RepID=A0AAV9R2G5_9TELE
MSSADAGSLTPLGQHRDALPKILMSSQSLSSSTSSMPRFFSVCCASSIAGKTWIPEFRKILSWTPYGDYSLAMSFFKNNFTDFFPLLLHFGFVISVKVNWITLKLNPQFFPRLL